MRFLFIFATLIVSPCIASDFFLMKTSLDENIKSLSFQDQLPVNTFSYSTPLGVTSRCYQASYYIVISENTSGRGYELTKNKPDAARCIVIPNASFDFSPAEIHLDMRKTIVQKRLGLSQPTNKGTLLFVSTVNRGTSTYDEQSWVDVEFSDEKLTRFSVFVSLTQ